MSSGAPVGGAMVDWDVATSTAARTSKPGPDVPIEDARAIVSSLRELAVEARDHVAALTGLYASAVDAPVAVVDRAAWVAANAEGFRTVIDPLVSTLRAKRDKAPGNGSSSRGVVDTVG